MAQPRVDAWMTREIDLAQRHEELLLRREALLQGTETYYDEQEKRAASFIASFPLAEERNRELQDDLNDFMRRMRRDVTDPGTPRFNTLKTNYWTMVKNVFPVWLEELKEYEQRQKNRRDVVDGVSLRPPPGSPPTSRTPRPVSSPGSPNASLEAMIVNGRPPSPGPRSPSRSPTPSIRPPSPDRKTTLKKQAKKNNKGAKSSKNKKK